MGGALPLFCGATPPQFVNGEATGAFGALKLRVSPERQKGFL